MKTKALQFTLQTMPRSFNSRYLKDITKTSTAVVQQAYISTLQVSVRLRAIRE